jgi:putative flippase GtrA
MILKQIFQFGMVGTCGALIDWAGFNLLVGLARWRRIPASIASTSCAMIWTFAGNWNFVFHPTEATTGIRALRFLIITCFSGWILQSLVIRVFGTAASLTRAFSGHSFNPTSLNSSKLDWVERNLAKLAAIFAGFIWNFCWYRAWVFAT